MRGSPCLPPGLGPRRSALRAAALGLACLCGVVGCGRRGDGRVVVFVVDSLSSMMPDQRSQLQFFEKLSHGDVVASLVRQESTPDVLEVHDVDGPLGKVDRDRYLRALATAAQFARDHPRDKVVVNVSLGSREPDPKERERVARLLRLGVVVVAAAGNDHGDSVSFPAAYDGVIAVAAAEGGRPAAYSNCGAEIDVVADGGFWRFDHVRAPSPTGVETRTRGITLKGTSFAAPRVAGAVARMLRLAGSRSIDARAILRQTATPLDGELFRQGKLGAGLLSSSGAFEAVDPSYRVYVFSAWLWRTLQGVLVVVGSLLLALVAYWRLTGEFEHTRVKRAARVGGLVAGVATPFLVAIVLRSGATEAALVPAFLAPFTEVAAGWLVLLVAGFGIVITGLATAGMLVARGYTHARVRSLVRGQDLRGLHHELNRCSRRRSSAVRRAILAGLFGFRRRAVPCIVEWLMLEPAPVLDERASRLLRDFAARGGLASALIRVAADDREYRSVRRRAVERLALVARREDGRVAAFLRYLDGTSFERAARETQAALEARRDD